MGYFEGLAAAAFKKGAGGQTLYYPWGIFGKGRILPDDDTERRARAFLIRYYKISLPASVVLALVLGLKWALVAGVLATAGFHMANKRLVGHLPCSAERLTLKEGYRNSAARHRASTLWLLLAASVVLGLVGIYLAVVAKTAAARHVAISGIAVFGLCGCAMAYMLKAKREFSRGRGASSSLGVLEGQRAATGASQQVRAWVIARTVVLIALGLGALAVLSYAYQSRDRLFPARDTVVIYGRHTCGLTRMVRQGLEAQGVPYLFADADIPAIDDELAYKLGPRFAARSITFPVVHVAGRMLLTPTAEQVQQALARHQASAGLEKSERDYGTLLLDAAIEEGSAEAGTE